MGGELTETPASRPWRRPGSRGCYRTPRQRNPCFARGSPANQEPGPGRQYTSTYMSAGCQYALAGHWRMTAGCARARGAGKMLVADDSGVSFPPSNIVCGTRGPVFAANKTTRRRSAVSQPDQNLGSSLPLPTPSRLASKSGTVSAWRNGHTNVTDIGLAVAHPACPRLEDGPPGAPCFACSARYSRITRACLRCATCSAQRPGLG